MANLWKNRGYVIKFRHSIFVIRSGLVDKVTVFQIEKKNSMVQIQSVLIDILPEVKVFLVIYIPRVSVRTGFPVRCSTWRQLSCGPLLHILIIFLFGIQRIQRLFIKEDKGIYMLYNRKTSKSQVNSPLRMHDLLEILKHAFRLLDGFFEYTYDYMFHTNMLKLGWVVLRIYVALAVFQPYRDLEAGDNQSLKFKWRGGESNPGSLAPQA